METLEQKIVELYTRGGFGKASKAEIDAAVFHHLLLEKLPGVAAGIAENGSIDYFRIAKTHIHALSLALRISEAAVTRLLENDYLLRQDQAVQAEKSQVGALLLDMLLKSGIRKENIKDGKLRFAVTNPIARKILQVQIDESGGIVDYSFNRDIVVIEVYDFLRLLNCADDGALRTEIWNLLNSKLKNGSSRPEDAQYKQFLAELEMKPLGEQIKSVLKGGAGAIAEKFLGGEGGKDALDLLTRLLNFAKQKIALPGANQKAGY